MNMSSRVKIRPHVFAIFTACKFLVEEVYSQIEIVFSSFSLPQPPILSYQPLLIINTTLSCKCILNQVEHIVFQLVSGCSI